MKALEAENAKLTALLAGNPMLAELDGYEAEIAKLKAENAKLIERCAQVAERYIGSRGVNCSAMIAAAIRELKV